jgi:plastocyanin
MKNIFICLTFLLLSKISLSTIVPVINSGFTFSPATITVNAGDTVSFSLGAIHNIAEVSQATFTANGNTQLPGGFFTPSGGGLVFTASLTPGTHWYVCQPHAAMGMKGKIIVQGAAGIAENLLQASISVYPNPTTSKVTVIFNEVISGKLQLSNSLGEVLEQTQINASVLTLDLGDRPKGFYFITVSDESGNKAIRKLEKI